MAITVSFTGPAAHRPVRPPLRLVGADGRPASGVEEWAWAGAGAPVLTVVPDRRTARAARPRRRVSPAVRRRRTMLAVLGLCALGLALPLGGAGGHSHAIGSAPAGNPNAVAYTVQPGDSLWSIAARIEPSADPRPLVAKLAAELGSQTVQPGEQITVP